MVLLTLHLTAANAAGLIASDGRPVVAATSGSGSLGVVLVAAEGTPTAAYDAVRERIAENDARVVVIDPRDADDGSGALDIAAAVTWVRDAGSAPVLVIADGDGGNLALHAAAAGTPVDRMVWLAPRLSAPGLSITSDLAGWGDRPLWLGAGSADAPALRAAGAVAKKAPGAGEVVVLDAGTSGAELLARDPRLESRILAWARPAESTAATEAAPAVSTDLGTLETTGTKYGR